MKKLTYILIVIISIATISISCKKDDNSQPAGISNSNFPTNLTSGSWRVSYFKEDSQDHTSQFNGYTFTFNGNETMLAVHSSGNTNGTGSLDDGNTEFHISIGSSAPLDDLSHGWFISSQSASEIRLLDDNSTSHEEVHFVKI